jgi:Tfp pilus assembly protein PilZ
MSEQEPVKEVLSEKRSPCKITFYVDDQPFKGTSTHFSERGILVLSQQPAPLNSKVRLVLQFPGFKNTVEVTGEVVWSNTDGPSDSMSPRGMGVKFLNLDRDTERLMGELGLQYEALGSMYSCYFT